jgi:hypothetical protein
MLAAPYFLGGAMLYILAIIVLLAVFGGTDEPRQCGAGQAARCNQANNMGY